MKRARLALVLLLLMLAPAAAQTLPLRLNRLQLYWRRPYADSIWIKVHLRNTSDHAIQKHFDVRLYVRKDNTEGWRPIRVWHETDLGAGEERTFMYQSRTEIMDPVLFTGQFQAAFEVCSGTQVVDRVEGAFP